MCPEMLCIQYTCPNYGSFNGENCVQSTLLYFFDKPICFPCFVLIQETRIHTYIYIIYIYINIIYIYNIYIYYIDRYFDPDSTRGKNWLCFKFNICTHCFLYVDVKMGSGITYLERWSKT